MLAQSGLSWNGSRTLLDRRCTESLVGCPRAVVHGQPSGDLCVDELDGAVRIIANLGHFLGNSGYADVAFPLALQVIDSHEQTPSRDLVVAMANTSRMMTSTRPEVALTLIARAEALARELGDEEAMGRVLIRKGSLGLAHYGTDERTRATIEGGIAHLRSSGALDWRNWYYNLALCCIELGDLAEAERLAELRLRAEQVGLTEGEGWTEFLFGTTVWCVWPSGTPGIWVGASIIFHGQS
jgi:hypothetical protein